MAKQCRVCEKIIDMPRKCRFCGERLCEEHMLPENHDCLGLRVDTESGESWFVEKFGGREDEPRERSSVNLSQQGPESSLLSSDDESMEESTSEESESSDNESVKQTEEVEQDDERGESENNRDKPTKQEKQAKQVEKNDESRPITSRVSTSQSSSNSKQNTKTSPATSHSGTNWSKSGQKSTSGSRGIRRWLRFGWQRLKLFVTVTLRLSGVALSYLGLIGVVWLLVNTGTAFEVLLSLGVSALGIALLSLTQ